MKKLFTFLLFLGFYSAFSQEITLEPSFLKEKPFALKATSIELVQLNDTLALPFVDDFSTNKLSAVLSSATPYTEYKQYQYLSLSKGLNFSPSTLSLDTSYFTVFGLTDTTKTPRLAADTLLQYNYTTYPAGVIDTLVVWDNYSLVDSLNDGNTDTIYSSAIFTNDSIPFGLVAIGDNLWLDHLVNINSNYPINLPSIGAATFDAVDIYGELYTHSTTAAFAADSLTSKCINLSGLSTSDQVFLSFMLEKKGWGDSPEDKDPLVLFFKDSSETWNKVWSSVDETSLSDTVFKSIYVQLNKSSYFFSGFQFRYVNYASLSTQANTWKMNADHYHLDYVILDKNRSTGDSYLQDLAFVYPPSTLINGYQSIPWKHYDDNLSLTQSTSNAKVNNWGSNAATVNFSTKISENGSLLYQSASANSAVIGSNAAQNFTENYGGFVFSSSEPDVASFQVNYLLNGDVQNMIAENDSVISSQVFDSYYAYDDGSAEAGYGINSYYGKVAIFFPLLVSSDTLTAFDMYFNNTKSGDNNSIPINLVVWKNNSGVPGDELYRGTIVNPRETDSLNVFLSYKLENKLVLTDDFFIGWEQQSFDFVNIGLDRNNNHSDKAFFNVNNTWEASQISGSLMLRPRFGSLSFLSSKEQESIALKAYPNPCQNEFYLQTTTSGGYYELSNSLGEIIGSGKVAQNNELIPLANYSEGMYFISLFTSEGEFLGQQKIIKL